MATTFCLVLAILASACAASTSQHATFISSSRQRVRLTTVADAVASTHKNNNKRHLFRISNSNDESVPLNTPNQVRIRPFELTLQPTPVNLEQDSDGQEQLHKVIQDTVRTYLEKNMSDATGNFAYVFLADFRLEYHTGDVGVRRLRRSQTTSSKVPSTTLYFNGGVASYSEPSTVYTEDQINKLIGRAMQEELMTALKALTSTTSGVTIDDAAVNGPFATLDQVLFIGQEAPPRPPTAAPVVVQEPASPTDDVDAIEQSVMGENEGEKKSSTGAVVGGSLGGTVFLMVGLFLLIQRTRSSSKSSKTRTAMVVDEENGIKKIYEMQDDAATDVDDFDCEPEIVDCTSQVTASNSGNYNRTGASFHGPENEMLDAQSATSDWTMRTDPATSVNANANAARHLVHAETFERDRQVHIRKDMMQSAWGDAGAGAGGGSAAAAGRFAMVPPRMGALQDFASWSTQQDGSVSVDPFLFEQAHEAGGGPPAAAAAARGRAARGEGEEIYLMPPSRTQQTRKIRTTSSTKATGSGVDFVAA
jgi:hypothetical protein